MSFIDSLGDIYCIRAKSNISIHIDNYEDSGLIATIADIEPYFATSKYFDSVQITSNNFQTKLAVSFGLPFLVLIMLKIKDIFQTT